MGRKISLSNRQVAAPGQQASRATVNQVNLAIEGKLALPAYLDAFEAIKAGSQPGDLFLKLRELDGEILSTGVIIPISKDVFEIFEAREGVERLEQLKASIENNLNEVEKLKTEIKAKIAEKDEQKKVLSDESAEAQDKAKQLQAETKKLEDELVAAEKAGDKKAVEDLEKQIKENKNKIAIIWNGYKKDDKEISELESEIRELADENKKLSERADKLNASLVNANSSIKELIEKADELEEKLADTGSVVANEIFRMATDKGYPSGPAS